MVWWSLNDARAPPGPLTVNATDTQDSPCSEFRKLFSLTASHEHARRFVVCQAIRDDALDKCARQPSRFYFESLHDLMLEQSDQYRDLMNLVASQQYTDLDATECDRWQQFHYYAIGQHEILGQALQGSDEQWVRSVLDETRSWLRDNPPKSQNETWRHFNASEVVSLIECGSRPNLVQGKVDAYFCSTTHAVSLIDSGAILVVNHQQPYPWNGQPIKDLFDTYNPARELDRKYPVCIPSLPMDVTDAQGNIICRGSCFKPKSLGQIRRNFLEDKVQVQRSLWNVLDMEQWVPVPYPPFLTHPNSQLLQSLKACNKGGTILSNRATTFMLLSHGGNHTSSHVDDCGSGVFLTVQQGIVGIGWIPVTWQKRIKWGEDPASVKQQARYVVLRPNQTIYLPPGTIHFVFRKAGQHTLITGGEIITWAGMRRWLCILKHQELCEAEVNVTRESSQQWADCVLEAMKQREQSDSWAILGGPEEAGLILSTLEKWATFKTMEDYFAFQGWDMDTF
ncbi:Ff.00g065170.m01.CDS01 [Fusarium sp. VM40]|nr:Ff.00g065170.m01.CDS01 [Fusarium sp. VM40]